MIETERLILRGWRRDDRAAYHAIKSDPLVMATLGDLPSRVDSERTLQGLIDAERQHGFTFWAMERRDDGALIGYAGLLPTPAETPVAGEVEIGWGLGSAHWGQGYAREAAVATLDWAWANTKSRRLVGITTPGNERSWGLMQRLGMRRDWGGDFDHPALAEGDPLRPHITYRIERPGPARVRARARTDVSAGSATSHRSSR